MTNIKTTAEIDAIERDLVDYLMGIQHYAAIRRHARALLKNKRADLSRANREYFDLDRQIQILGLSRRINALA